MSSTSSENNKTTYQHLPKQGSPGKIIFDDENDELLDALKFLRQKVAALSSNPTSPRDPKKSEIQTQTVEPTTPKVILRPKKTVTYDSALPTPRNLNPEITEQIRNRISNILRPPDYDDINFLTSDLSPRAKVFLDKEIDIEHGFGDFVDREEIQKLDLSKGDADNEIIIRDEETQASTETSPRATQTSRQASPTINEKIEEQLLKADLRCTTLEKQLEQMRTIVKQTTEHNSAKIEEIIRESKNDIENMTKKAIDNYEAKHILPAPKTPKIDLNDEKFIEKVVERLKQEKLDKKKLAKVAKKLSLHCANSEDMLNRLKSSKSSSFSPSATPTKTAYVKPYQPKPKQVIKSTYVGNYKHNSQEKTPNYARDTYLSSNRKKNSKTEVENRVYQIKLSEIPFLSGTKPGKSYHAGANIQQLLADIKHSRQLIRPVTSGNSANIQSKRDLIRNVQNVRDCLNN